MATKTSRFEERQLHYRVADGLDAMQIRDGAARQVVRDFTDHIATSDDYRRSYELWAGDDEAGQPLDFEGHLRHMRLLLWTTPSMSYLAIGGRTRTALERDLVDGYRIIAQVQRNRIDVHGSYMHGVLIRSSVIPFPGYTDRPTRTTASGTRQVVAVCPRCFTTLPATGECDTC